MAAIRIGYVGVVGPKEHQVVPLVGGGGVEPQGVPHHGGVHVVYNDTGICSAKLLDICILYMWCNVKKALTGAGGEYAGEPKTKNDVRFDVATLLLGARGARDGLHRMSQCVTHKFRVSAVRINIFLW